MRTQIGRSAIQTVLQALHGSRKPSCLDGLEQVVLHAFIEGLHGVAIEGRDKDHVGALADAARVVQSVVGTSDSACRRLTPARR
jgi:hypothetical protein